MARYKVTCITKPNRFSSHEHITHIGSYAMRWDRDTAIRLIESGAASFYVHVGGYETEVTVVHPRFPEHAYLRTRADSTGRDNLLSLPEC